MLKAKSDSTLNGSWIKEAVKYKTFTFNLSEIRFLRVQVENRSSVYKSGKRLPPCGPCLLFGDRKLSSFSAVQVDGSTGQNDHLSIVRQRLRRNA